jgi:HlyD family type I secretion membrane fusion protein
MNQTVLDPRKFQADKRKVPVVRRRTDIVGEVVGAFESETAAVLLRSAPRNERVIMYTIITMMILAVTLMAIVKLDVVVTSVGGRIVPITGMLYVNPFDTGIVKQVNVKAGQVVKKGQALATLDPTFTTADLVQLKQHMASDLAQIAREDAELAGQPYVFSSQDPYQSIQGGLWQKRHAQYLSDLANFDGQIHSTEAQMLQAQSDADKYESRLKIAGDLESVYRPLLDKGYVSKLQLMQATDSRTEMSRLLADAKNQIEQYREAVSALKAQKDSYIHKWHSDTLTQLVADRNDRDTTRDSLDKAQKMSDLTTLDAPEDAIVLKVGKLSQGSVTAGAGAATLSPDTEPLFTLWPLHAAVEAEIKVSAQDIGFIRLGDPVAIKLDAYSYVRHGAAKGVVKSISEGSFITDDNNQPAAAYYKILVTITDAHLRNVPPSFRLIPGNTLTGDILTNRRTILSYLVEGVVKTTSQAMREPE